MRTVADAVCRLAGEPDGWTDASGGAQPHEANVLRLDTTKARTQLGWAPRWRLDEALAASLEVYRSERTGAALRELMLEQIGRYAAAGTTGG